MNTYDVIIISSPEEYSEGSLFKALKIEADKFIGTNGDYDFWVGDEKVAAVHGSCVIKKQWKS